MKIFLEMGLDEQITQQANQPEARLAKRNPPPYRRRTVDYALLIRLTHYFLSRNVNEPRARG